MCQESASCSREGAYLNESIDDVFLGCECTEACCCARDGGGIIGEWFGGASLSACAQAAEYGGKIPGGDSRWCLGNGACSQAVFGGGSISSISRSCMGDGVYHLVRYGETPWG